MAVSFNNSHLLLFALCLDVCNINGRSKRISWAMRWSNNGRVYIKHKKLRIILIMVYICIYMLNVLWIRTPSLTMTLSAHNISRSRSLYFRFLLLMFWLLLLLLLDNSRLSYLLHFFCRSIHYSVYSCIQISFFYVFFFFMLLLLNLSATPVLGCSSNMHDIVSLAKFFICVLFFKILSFTLHFCYLRFCFHIAMYVVRPPKASIIIWIESIFPTCSIWFIYKNVWTDSHRPCNFLFLL